MTSQLDVDCSSCGATLCVEAHQKTTRCPYCDSPSVIERPPTPDRPLPQFVVGFVLDQRSATQQLRAWLRGKLFAHSGLKRATLDKTRGVYVPAFLYTATARTAYRALIGENYTETETYTTTDANGNTVTRTRTVTRTEWRELVGSHACYVNDIVVTASRSIANHELEAIEPFDLRALRRYRPELLAGWPAEEPSLPREACLARAHEESLMHIGGLLGEFMPGDSYRDLQYRTELHDEVIDQVILPVWVFAVRYAEDKALTRLLVNGQTGMVTGRVPLSWIKITLTVLGGLALVALLALPFFL